jgi:hypothetical protein
LPSVQFSNSIPASAASELNPLVMNSNHHPELDLVLFPKPFASTLFNADASIRPLTSSSTSNSYSKLTAQPGGFNQLVNRLNGRLNGWMTNWG